MRQKIKQHRLLAAGGVGIDWWFQGPLTWLEYRGLKWGIQSNRFAGCRPPGCGWLSIPFRYKTETTNREIKNNSSGVGSLCSPLLGGGLGGGQSPGPSSVPSLLAAAPPLAPLSPFSLPHLAGRGSPNKGEHMCVVIPILAHVFTIHGGPRRPRRVPGYGGGGVVVGVEVRGTQR